MSGPVTTQPKNNDLATQRPANEAPATIPQLSREEKIDNFLEEYSETASAVESKLELPKGILDATIRTHLSSISDHQFSTVEEQILKFQNGAAQDNSPGYEDDPSGNTRVGIGLVSIRSSIAAETRGLNINSGLQNNYDAHYLKLLDPVQNIETLGKVIKENMAHFTQIPGKEHLELFALAKYFSNERGGGDVSDAQNAAASANPRETFLGFPIGPDPRNDWSKVSQHLDSTIAYKNVKIVDAVAEIAKRIGIDPK